MKQIDKCLGNCAIVIGGSIAGLLSARVLTDYFKQVIIKYLDKINCIFKIK